MLFLEANGAADVAIRRVVAAVARGSAIGIDFRQVLIFRKNLGKGLVGTPSSFQCREGFRGRREWAVPTHRQEITVVTDADMPLALSRRYSTGDVFGVRKKHSLVALRCIASLRHLVALRCVALRLVPSR
jgi:hypothetical protein